MCCYSLKPCFPPSNKYGKLKLYRFMGSEGPNGPNQNPLEIAMAYPHGVSLTLFKHVTKSYRRG